MDALATFERDGHSFVRREKWKPLLRRVETRDAPMISIEYTLTLDRDTTMVNCWNAASFAEDLYATREDRHDLDRLDEKSELRIQSA